MQLSKHVFTALMLMIFHSGAFAENLNDNYQVEIVVKDRSQEVFEAALPQALGAVLEKMSGNPEVVNDAAIKDQLGKAKRYVERYEYRPDPDDPDHHNLILQLKFSTKSLRELLGNQSSLRDTASNENINLHVYGVSSLNDLSGVVQYLRGLNVVTSVEASTVNSDDVILSVKSSLGIGPVKKAIEKADDHRLQAIEANEKSESDHDMLSYRWTT